MAGPTQTLSILVKIVKFIFFPFKKKLFIGVLLGIIITIFFNIGIKHSSSDIFCESCHVHPHSTTSWKQSPHFDNPQGIAVHCVECHLPPSGSLKYYTAKAVTGLRDVYGVVFKDVSKINWDEKSKLENAVHYTYKASCTHCHANLFPVGLTKKGEDAHLYYTQNPDELQCINCHLHVGHYSEQAEQEFKLGTVADINREIFTNPAKVSNFENYTEFIPGTPIKFDMVAIPGGQFEMGSPDSEPYRGSDEGPQVKTEIKSFWMAKTEVSWDEFEAFYAETSREGRTDTRVRPVSTNPLKGVDAITGPTPPYGNPDQGFGKGSRPAITMTYYAAQVYCEWLSLKTGKTYRLPTEAEWEYACRAGTDTPYFFKGSPKSYSRENFWNKITGIDTTRINTFVVYKENSNGETQPPEAMAPNPFGLINMLGNVREFCTDWYAPDTYEKYSKQAPVTEPTGPASGEEHVVRGGSYKMDASMLRCADRDFTQHDKWMKTDPQIPKSLWWYSDCTDVGFRVVCEYNQ